MISRHTSSVPKEDEVSHRLAVLRFEVPQDLSTAPPGILPVLAGAPRLLSVLRNMSPVLTTTLKAHRTAHPEFDTHLSLTHRSVNSTSSQTLLEASRD